MAQSFGRQISDLEVYIKAEYRPGTPEGHFALNVYEAAGEVGPLSGWESPVSMDALRQGHGPVLAAESFRLSSGTASPPADLVQAWEDGAVRLSGRNAFPTDRQTFAFRPIELYGISLGVSRLFKPDHKLRSWLKDVLSRLEREGSDDPFAYLFCGACAKLLGSNWVNRRGGRSEEAHVAELSLRRWLLVTKGSPGAETTREIGQIDGELLRLTALAQVETTDVAKAALLHHALRRAVRERLESELKASWLMRRDTEDAVAIVVNLCRHFPLFARQIQVRHDSRKTIQFKDEYDVQDAMHAILKIHFDDVRAEEWTPSYAGSSSRIDFLLKREKVVVEVKMTRKTLGQKEVVNQLIHDKERYRTHQDYRTLVCFVYDPEGRCDNPAALESDVSEDDGEFRVITVVSPKGT